MAARKKKATEVEPAVQAGVRFHEQEYEVRKLSDLAIHPKNSNKGAKEVIAESIDANGFYGAPLVQKSSSLILAGNHRVEDLRARGVLTVPCIIIDCTDDEAERIMEVDNRANRMGHTDQAKLHSLMEKWRASERGLRGTGYSENDYLKSMTKMNPPERMPEFRETVKHQYACPNCGHTWTSQK